MSERVKGFWIGYIVAVVAIVLGFLAGRLSR